MKRIFIYGGCNVDIAAVPFQKIALKDSNPSSISYSYGGVGRNIAENLVLLKEDVSLVSAVGDDVFGSDMYEYCTKQGIDMRYTLVSKQYKTSVYLAVLDENRDLEIGMVDMGILDEIDKPYLAKTIANINKDDLVVLDTNYSRELIVYLMDNLSCPIYLDPISVNKVVRVEGYLNKLHMFKPNIYEAEKLCGFSINENNYQASLDYFINEGISEIIISMGSQGTIASDGLSYVKLVYDPVTVKNVTGAGDGFMAGYIYARNHDYSFVDSLVMATAVSLLTITCQDTVNQKLSLKSIEETIIKYHIEGVKIC